jgi:hypothetical protein
LSGDQEMTDLSTTRVTFRKITPVLRVNDLQETVDYYTGVLGFRPLWRSPADGGGENCMMTLGDVAILFSTGDHLGGAPSFTGTLYIDMTGIDAYYERLKDSVTLVWPLEVMEYGQKEFGVRECNGYTLAFAESVGG